MKRIRDSRLARLGASVLGISAFGALGVFLGSLTNSNGNDVLALESEENCSDYETDAAESTELGADKEAKEEVYFVSCSGSF